MVLNQNINQETNGPLLKHKFKNRTINRLQDGILLQSNNNIQKFHFIFLLNNIRAQGFCEMMLLQWDVIAHGGKTWSAHDRLELIEASIEQGSYKKLQPFFKDFSWTFQGPH